MPKAKSDAKAADSRLKRKGAGAGRKQSKKAAKDPNKPKRPPSAFFVFMSEFREQFKKEHPNNKSVAVVGKAGGDKWKSLSDAVICVHLMFQEKAPFVATAEKKKQEYEKTILAYNKKLEGKNSEEDESDKSKSEVNDDEEDEEEEDDDDDE
ncbi:HMG1/2-like protein isoform B [Glycine soja]|uniref:HMG1/2-like protein isoform B n=1 Tax=Glycine soja TaxID=3848 RepID=A0A445J3J0_GLYSO|nr:HMG1/2-like protein isoform B [Glycine soja]